MDVCDVTNTVVHRRVNDAQIVGWAALTPYEDRSQMQISRLHLGVMRSVIYCPDAISVTAEDIC